MKQARQMVAILIAATMLISVSGFAAVPQLVDYQGRLTNSVGVPLDTTVALVFTICSDSLGVTNLWSETHSGVVIKGGLFQILLGSVTPLSESVFNGSKRWLSVQLQGGSAPTTLLPIVSVAYAYRAAKSDTASYALSSGGVSPGGWADDGTAVRLTTGSDNVGIGTSAPAARLDVKNSNSSGLATLIRNDNAANSDQALWVETNGNGAAVFGSSPFKYGLHGMSANSYGVYGTGSKGVYGFHIDSRHYGYLGSGSYGVFGKDSTTGNWGAIGGGNIGVYGEGKSTSSYGLFGYNNGGGIGIIGGSTDSIAIHGASANDIGVYGTGTKGVYGYHPSSKHYGYLGSSSYGVYGKDSTTGAWGALGANNAGVIGSGQGASQVAVFGENGGNGVGVRGSSIDSCGIYGSSATDWGVLGTGTRGVYGLHPTSGNYGYLGSSQYGVYGEYKENGNHGYLGGQQAAVEGYSANRGGVIGQSVGNTGVSGSSTDGAGVSAYSFHGSAVHATTTAGGGGLAGLFDGPVQINCDYQCDSTMLRLNGKAVFSQNDGELVLRTDDQGDPGRYRLKFDNNNLGVMCGSDYDNQIFAFMSQWGANRKYDAHLQIHGSTPAGGSWGKYLGLYHDGTDGYLMTDAGHIVFSPASNVGIGTSTPGYKLDVAGSCHATSFPTSSDLRLKTDIRPLTGALDKISKIRGVSFSWNERYQAMGRSTGHREIGVVAQDVEAVLPELVTQWGDKDYRAVDYGRLTAVLIEAVKELKADNEALKQRLEVLEKKK